MRYYTDSNNNLYYVNNEPNQVNFISKVTHWITIDDGMGIPAHSQMNLTLPENHWLEISKAMFIAKLQFMGIVAHTPKDEEQPDSKIVELLRACAAWVIH